MISYMLVALGGGIGATIRFFVSGLVLHSTVSWSFPLPTFLVNVAGCLLAGAFLAVSERLGGVGEQWRLFLLTGILGGFTTFSAFGVETISLLKRGQLGVALAYVVGSVTVGLCALYLGTVLLGQQPPE